MNPEILTLCEYASDHDGSLTIIDTFDVVEAAKLPWRAYFYLAAKINIRDCESDFRSIRLRITPLNDHSKVVFDASSAVTKPDGVDKLNVVAGLKGLIFENAGDYCFSISLDDELVAEYIFKVKLNGDEQ